MKSINMLLALGATILLGLSSCLFLTSTFQFTFENMLFTDSPLDPEKGGNPVLVPGAQSAYIHVTINNLTSGSDLLNLYILFEIEDSNGDLFRRKSTTIDLPEDEIGDVYAYYNTPGAETIQSVDIIGTRFDNPDKY